MSDVEELEQIIAEMQGELGELRAELALLRARSQPESPPAAPPPLPDEATTGTSRRQLLRRGGVVIGAGVAAAAVTPHPAAAATGDPVKQDGTTTGSGSTKVSSSGAGADALYGEATSATGQAWGVRGESGSSEGIGVMGGASAGTGATSGVEGRAWSDQGAGVVGENRATSGPAVGVRGRTESNHGTAVYGVAGADHGPTLYAGVSGSDSREFGNGVLAFATGKNGTGVSSTVFGDNGTAMYGYTEKGDGLLLDSKTGTGAVISGQRAALELKQSGPPPATRTDAHKPGEIYFDSNDLWLCTQGGTPGTWRKLSTPGLTPVTPFRVYDSRFGTGVLLQGQNRIISVRDAVDLTTGAVLVQNAVPAGAVGVTFNLAITETVGAGYLAATPGDATVSASASINWDRTGLTLSNATLVNLDAARQMKIFAGGIPGSRTEFVIDITGFFS